MKFNFITLQVTVSNLVTKLLGGSWEECRLEGKKEWELNAFVGRLATAKGVQ